MSSNPESPSSPVEMPKVYLLPNLMTAGNLFCGFMAILQIIAGSLGEATGTENWIQQYERSLLYILGAFIFDMLDGRLARLGGKESSFGREFDSIADVISFGLAPALLVLKIILADLPERFHWLGWLIAFIYLLAGAMRLARFNIVSAQPQSGKDFLGFPIPAAAGLVASITLLLLTFYEKETTVPNSWKYIFPILLLFLSFMMYSKIMYPSFKAINWKAKRFLPQVLIIAIIIILIVKTWRYSLALVFVSYLIYGFIRPFISKKIIREIEEEDEEDSKTA